MPIFVLVKQGVEHKDIFDGVATKVIKYETYTDVTASLASIVTTK